MKEEERGLSEEELDKLAKEVGLTLLDKETVEKFKKEWDEEFEGKIRAKLVALQQWREESAREKEWFPGCSQI